MKNRCAARAGVRAVQRIGMERLGRRPRNTRFQPAPGLSAADVAEADAASGRSDSRWQLSVRTAGGRRRSRVCRRRYRLRVFARCRDRLRPLVVPRRRRCAHRADSRRRQRRARLPAVLRRHPGNVYAVNAETGAQVWKERLDPHPVARVTGAPKLADGRLYVPLSSLEESGAGNPSYPCCTFRGGVAAYDALTGKRLWKILYRRRRAEAPQGHVEGHAALGARRRRRVVVADGRSAAARRLCRDRQRLHGAG